MILKKRELKLLFFLVFYFFLSLIFGITVNASESQILRTIEIEEGAEDHLIKNLPWDRDSLDIEVFYQGKDINLPLGNTKMALHLETVYKIKLYCLLYLFQNCEFWYY